MEKRAEIGRRAWKGKRGEQGVREKGKRQCTILVYFPTKTHNLERLTSATSVTSITEQPRTQRDRNY
jgi:hypothetical protein